MPAAKKAAAAKPASKKSASPRSTADRSAHDAIKLLTADHDEVRALFKQYDKLVSSDGGDSEKKQLAESICQMLTIHAQIEEEIFYPAAREVLEDQDLVDEADIEHASAKELIQQIQASEPSDAHYDAKVKVLGEYVSHHAKEEETQLFKEIKKAGLDAAEVGEALASRKEELSSTMNLETAV